MIGFEAGLFFAAITWATWRGGRGNGGVAYVFAAFVALAGIPWLHETIGDEFWREMPYCWAMAIGLLVVGFARNHCSASSGASKRSPNEQDTRG